MNGEIEVVKTRVLDLYEQQRQYLNSKPNQFLKDLLHRSEEQRDSAEFSTRTAAEINRAACVLILEERGAR